MKRRLALSLASLAFAAAAQAAATSMPPPQATGSAERLLQKHLSSFLKNDLDAVMSDYANDAVLVTAQGTYRGTGQIREFFRNLMKQFPAGASTVALDHRTFDGDLIYFIWHGKTPTLEVRFATDTMIVRGGKIVTQTFAGELRPARP